MVNITEVNSLLKKTFSIKKTISGDLFYTRKDYLEYEGNILQRELGDFSWDQFQNKEGKEKLAQLFGVEKKFSFLTDLGFVYFLPAFITYMLTVRDYEFMQFCLFNISPGDSEISLNRVGGIYSLLDDEQVNTVKGSLLAISENWRQWGVEENMAKVALMEYWNHV